MSLDVDVDTHIDLTDRSRLRQILIVDDHRSVAEAFAHVIESRGDACVVAVVGDVDEALRVVSTEQVDVVVMDVGLPGTDGIEGTRLIKAMSPSTNVFIFTGLADTERLARAAAAGASGFFEKYMSLDDAIDAIGRMVDGMMVVDPHTLTQLLATVDDGQPPAEEPAEPPSLTPREWEVLELLCAGRDAQLIAQTLGMSVHTARGHLKSILGKLDAHTQLEAVVLTTRNAWLQRPTHPREGGRGTTDRTRQ